MQGGQDVALDHVQQRVVARHFKSFAEQQLRGDFDIVARAVIQLIVGNRHISSATANIDGGHAQRAPRLCARLYFAVRTGERGEERFCLAAEMGNGFVVQPHELSAAGFVPLHLDSGNRNHALILLLAAGKIVILRVPAHRFPDDGDGFKHAAAENLALLFRHRRGQGQDQGTQLAWRGRETQTQTRGDAVDLAESLSEEFAQHVRHQRAAAVLR
ncbi:hypothetical protein D3C72_774450 [compost metagenome]